jgi:hypothetical protein
LIVRRILFVALLCAALSGFSASVSYGDDGGSNGDASQLVDLTHQVGDIEHKIADLRAHGRWAKSGALLASADCGYGAAAPFFLPWGDPSSYALAPQGDLSDTSQWTLKKTSLSVDHDPFSPSQASLVFGGDGQAVTPAMCVNLANPTIRLFIRDINASGKARLKIDVLYEDFDGHVQHTTIAKLVAGDAWQPSVAIPIGVNILSTASANGVTAVAFAFKAEGLKNGESWAIDGLYVDPFSSR